MSVPMPHGFVLLLLLAALGAVGICDLRFRKIPNELVATIAAGGVIHAFAASGPRAVIASILGAVAGVALLAWPFSRGVLGGGDVKLLGAVGACVGVVGALRALLYGSLLGGLLSLVFLVRLKRTDRSQVGAVLRSFALGGTLDVPAPEKLSRARGIPYAIALAGGGAWVLYFGVGR
jgi:prepilin peptidase CpaA